MKTLIFLLVAFVSLQASAQRVEIGRDSKTFTVSPTTHIVNLNFNIPVYRYDFATRVIPSICYETQCTTESGDGKDGDWKGFFNVRSELKAQALADAVKGIGVSIAEKIVRYDLLTHKPDSWSLFVAEIRKIEKKLKGLGFPYSFADEVINIYGYENRINLGYSTAQSCTKVPYNCYITEVVEIKTKVQEIPRDLKVYIKDQTLQSFEKDTVTLTVGNENNEIYISSEGFNNYTGVVLARGSQVELSATRIKAALPTKDITVTTAKIGARQLQVDARIPQKFFAEDKDATVSMTVEVCKTGFLGLGCTTQGTYIYDNVSAVTTKVFNVAGAGNYFARVYFVKENSKYYSSAKSSVITTSKLKF